MKILVVQLARLGDVFQTYPVLAALRRTQPTAEIHLLVRTRFRDAAFGLKGVHLIEMDTGEILRPILEGEAGSGLKSCERLRRWAESLRGASFDQIINLSFSPFSAHLVDFIATPRTSVRGYRLHGDGLFNPNDDFSSFFHAQVGPEGFNRIHINDLFAGVAGVELEEEDYNFFETPHKKNQVVLQLGASDARKACHPYWWRSAVTEILRFWPGQVILVGAPSEAELGEKFLEGRILDRVENRIGQTSLSQLAELVAQSRFAFSCDSMLTHVANLCGTPQIQISFPMVNPWETGPKVPNSRILLGANPESLSPKAVSALFQELLTGVLSGIPHLKTSRRVPTQEKPESHDAMGIPLESRGWGTISSMYFGRSSDSNMEITLARPLQQSRQLVDLVLTQLNDLNSNPGNQLLAEVVGTTDLTLRTSLKMHPSLAPLGPWLATEMARMAPGSMETLIGMHKGVYNQVSTFLDHMAQTLIAQEGETTDGNKDLEL